MKKIHFVVAVAFLFSTTAQAGGPWPKPKGKGYFKLSEWWINFDQHFTDNGQIDPNITTGIYNTSLYAEYGITNRLTGIAYVPFFSRNTMNNLRSSTTGDILISGGALNSFGDSDIGLKYGLTKSGAKVPFSATVFLGLPLGNPSAGEFGNLQTGDGEFNQILQLDAGHGFALGKKTSAYASAYAGFNNRTNGFSDEFRYGIEAGAGFIDRKLWTIFRLTGIESLKNGASVEQVTSTSIFANNTEFTSYSAEVALYVYKNIGVSAGFASAFRGEIIAARPSYSVGVFWDMR